MTDDRLTDKQAELLKKRGVAVNYNMSKQEASKLIEQILGKNKPETPEKASEMAPKPKFDTSSYYVAYAKDILVALIAKLDSKETTKEVVTEMAGLSIQIVMSMRNQFRE